MKIAIMRETVNLFATKQIMHEIKEYEEGATEIRQNETYILFDYTPQKVISWT